MCWHCKSFPEKRSNRSAEFGAFGFVRLTVSTLWLPLCSVFNWRLFSFWLCERSRFTFHSERSFCQSGNCGENLCAYAVPFDALRLRATVQWCKNFKNNDFNSWMTNCNPFGILVLYRSLPHSILFYSIWNWMRWFNQVGTISSKLT